MALGREAFGWLFQAHESVDEVDVEPYIAGFHHPEETPRASELSGLFRAGLMVESSHEDGSLKTENAHAKEEREQNSLHIEGGIQGFCQSNLEEREGNHEAQQDHHREAVPPVSSGQIDKMRCNGNPCQESISRLGAIFHD